MKRVTCKISESPSIGGGGNNTMFDIKGLGIKAKLELNVDIEDIKINETYNGKLKINNKNQKSNTIGYLCDDSFIWRQFRIYNFLNTFADYWYLMFGKNNDFNKKIIRVGTSFISKDNFISLVNMFRYIQKIRDNDFGEVKISNDTQFNIRIYDLNDREIKIGHLTNEGFKFETFIIEIFSFDNDIYTKNDDSNVQIDDTFIKKSRLYYKSKEINGKEKDYKIYFNEKFKYHVFYRNLFGGFDCLFFEDNKGNKYITDMYFPKPNYTFNNSDYGKLVNGIRMVVREIKYINNQRVEPIYIDGKKIILVLEIVVENNEDDETKGYDYKCHPSEYQSLYLRLLCEDVEATNLTFMLINNKDEEVNGFKLKEYHVNVLFRSDDDGVNTDFKKYDPEGNTDFEDDFDKNGYLIEGQLPNYFINKYPK